MLNSTKIVLIYPGITLASKNQVSVLAATFLNRSLLILRAAANDTHLAVLLESNSLICCSIQRLRQACIHEGIIPSVSQTRLSNFLRLTEKWPEKWPTSKTTLDQSCTQLMEGKTSLVEFLKQQPAQLLSIKQYQSSLQLYKNLTSDSKPLTKKRGHMIISPSNTGKTTVAIQNLLKNQPYYMKDLTTLTFDQYFGEPAILIDGLTPSSMLLPLLKKIVDVVSARVNVQNGSVLVRFETVVVTTQYSLIELTQDQRLREALMERFFFYTIGEAFTLKKI